MAFSFGGASGTAASPFSFSSTPVPAFGASPSPFGASSAAAFGQQSAPSFFGATNAPAFGATTTPAGAFGTPAPGLFGATTPGAFSAAATPSFFGGTPASGSALSLFAAPAVGAAQSQPAFGSFFGGAPAQQLQQPLGFGLQQAGAQGQQLPGSAAALVTKDGKMLSHGTKWEDIGPQGQAYLLELEKVVGQCRGQSRQLEECERLRGGGSRQLKQEMEKEAQLLRQGLQYVGSLLKEDMETVASFREKALRLLRDTEVAVLTFQRSHRWREACKGAPGQMLPPNMREQLGGPLVLPSAYLRHAVKSLQEAVQQYQKLVAELEHVLLARSMGDGRPGGPAADPLQSLPAAMHNVHAFFTHVAARLEQLHEAVTAAKDDYTSTQRQGGNSSDPFAAAERRELQQKAAAKSRVPSIPPAAPLSSGAPLGSAPALGAPAPAPASTGGGMFGSTASPFGTAPAFGGPAAAAAGGWSLGGADAAAGGTNARKGRKTGR